VAKSRRTFLRCAFAAAIGAGLFLVADDLTRAPLVQGVKSLGLSSTSANDSTESRASLLTVRVYYAMMAQYVSVSDEYFVLQNPVTLQDLMNTVVVRHPSMAQMIQTMLILLDGIPAKPAVSLKDGDNIQFIPVSAGG
jgi:molybdopterin converting factor small subunit